MFLSWQISGTFQYLKSNLKEKKTKRRGGREAFTYLQFMPQGLQDTHLEIQAICFPCLLYCLQGP